VEFIQISHAALSPVVYDSSIVEEIAPILVEKSIWSCQGSKCASVEVGIETGSSRLMRQHMRGKMLPYAPEQWPDIVVRSMEILNDNGIYPLATLILGLPGERKEDVAATIELLERLEGLKLFYVPLLFTSEEESKLRKHEHREVDDLSDSHWEILSTCWKHNVEIWSPEKRPFIAMAGIMTSPFYVMRHGTKAIRSILKISGLSDMIIGRSPRIPCRQELCAPDGKASN
ncbi:MAG: hypothetical protein QW520_05020, partial [Methanomassiliicoccales archaeon]